MFQWREAPILVGTQCKNRQQKALVCDTENLRIVYETRENIFSFDNKTQAHRLRGRAWHF